MRRSLLPVDNAALATIRDTIKPTQPREKIMARNLTSYDLGLAAGRQEGRQEGREEGIRTLLVESLEAYLDTKFGPLTESTLLGLRAKSTEELRTLALAWPKAQSLAELGL